MYTTDLWSRGLEIAAALREGREVPEDDEAIHERLFPPSSFPPDGLKHAGRSLWFSLTAMSRRGTRSTRSRCICLSGPAAALTRSRY